LFFFFYVFAFLLLNNPLTVGGSDPPTPFSRRRHGRFDPRAWAQFIQQETCIGL